MDGLRCVQHCRGTETIAQQKVPTIRHSFVADRAHRRRSRFRRLAAWRRRCTPIRSPSAYGRWAPVYDLVFGPVFRHGRRAAIEAAERIGGRILEVGVGTGISLPDYAPAQPRHRRRHLRADAREGARARARARARQRRGDRGDGCRERSTSPTTRSTSSSRNMSSPPCPTPKRALDEFARVVRPGGEIVITTRVGAEKRPARHDREGADAGHQPARLPHRIRLRALHRLGRHGAATSS